ncbi:hypothetical protein ACP4OV_012091 [Aristida adscensionis]
MRPSLLVGDVLYFILELGKGVLMYDLDWQELSVVDPPEVYEHGGVVMTTEDGGWGFAGMEGSKLYLYSWEEHGGEADDDEADGDESNAGWVLYRIIKLKER